MGAKRKEPNRQSNLGPGQYDPKTSRDFNNSSSKNIPASPFLSKTKRTNLASKSQILSPGPGAYEPRDEVTKPKNPTFGMSKGQKGISRKDLSPGPGAYDGTTKEFGQDAPKVTIKGRPQTAKANDLPGPGAYDNHHKTIDETSRSARGTSAMRNKSARLSPDNKDKLLNPGPGAYDAREDFVKAGPAKITFGKGERS